MDGNELEAAEKIHDEKNTLRCTDGDAPMDTRKHIDEVNQ